MNLDNFSKYILSLNVYMNLDKFSKYILSRVFILMFLIGVADIAFIDSRWQLLAGLVFGSFTGIARFFINRRILGILLTSAANYAGILSVLVFILNMLLLIFFMVIAALLDVNIFLGIAAGILLVPLALTSGGFLSAAGIGKKYFL